MTAQEEGRIEQLMSELDQLKQRVRELEESEAALLSLKASCLERVHFFQTLVDTIPSPIFYKDNSAHYIGCNRAFLARLGLEADSVVGKTAYEVFPKEQADKYHSEDMELLHNPGEQFFEGFLNYPNGEQRAVIILKATFRNMKGEIAGLVGVTIDITERKIAEDALKKAHDELEVRVQERTAELAGANRELRNEILEREKVEAALVRSSEHLKLFAYSVAHDLKSPAVGIYGLARLLSTRYRDNLDERGILYCEQILSASEMIAALVEQITTFAAAKEAKLTFESVSTAEILRMVHEEFSARLSIRGVHWKQPELLPTIIADRVSLVRMFRNLIDNAFKYGGDPLDEISIGYEGEPGFHVFTIADNGVGMRSEDSEKVFGFFERSDASPIVEGAGLGLAIVKSIAERHRGHVRVESHPGQGTRFIVSLAVDPNHGETG